MKNFIPKILSIDVTNQCNSNCVYCRDIHNNKKRELSEKTILDIIKKTINQIESLEWLKISGGEPLLFGKLKELVIFCREKKLNTILQTNGRLLTKKIVGELKQAGLKKVQLSIDGQRKIQDKLRGNGALNAVVKAAKNCKDVGLIFQFKCTISKINKNNLEKLFLLSQKLSPEKLNFRFLLPIGKAKKNDLEIHPEERKEIIKKIYGFSKRYDIEVITGDPCSYLFISSLKNKKIKDYEGACNIGINSIHISSDGYYKPCSMIDLILGDVLKENFWNIWENNSFLHKNRGRNFIKCKDCINKKKCGGCRSVAFANSGNYFGEDISCFIT